MSDFKYAAINSALCVARESNIGDFSHVVDGVFDGTYPVVDGSSAYRFLRTDQERFTRAADDYSVIVKSGKAEYPIRRFCLFIESDKMAQSVPNVDRAAFIAFADLAIGFWCFLSAKDRRDSKVLATHLTFDNADEAKKISLFTMSIIRCFSSWMGVRNAECEEEHAPRAARRRYTNLASVRFRRVFIRPVRRGAQSERYEITGDNCPRHHVRGHMRYVSQEKPLFGNRNSPKCWGAMWISEHWRGDEENGRVIQEYVPLSPETA